MKTEIYRVSGKQVEKTSLSLNDIDLNSNDQVLAIDILVKDHALIEKALLDLGFESTLIQELLRPEENLRFTYSGEILYGGLSYYSERKSKTFYATVLVYKNLLFNIYQEELGLTDRIIQAFDSLGKTQIEKFNIEYLLYLFVIEFMSYNGAVLLKFRNEIEKYSSILRSDPDAVTPEYLLDSKGALSEFTMVVEQLSYTLSFPPARDMLDAKSPYKIYFSDLSKSLILLRNSINQLDTKLESLTDHLDLIQQEKSNKKLKYLTIIQAVFVPLTLIAGIYGMNFKYMPELDLQYGYFYSLLLMVIMAVATFFYFYKKDWFD